MQLERYDSESGFRVWFNNQDYQTLLDAVDDAKRTLWLRLQRECGLRPDEVGRVTHDDIRWIDDDHAYLRVKQSKTGYRETPIPSELVDDIEKAVSYGDLRKDEPVVDRHADTLSRWMREAREEVAEQTGNSDWQYATPHDLRRTWATYTYYSIPHGSAQQVVMSWGGWSDADTFFTNYVGRVPDEVATEMMDAADIN